YGGHGGIALFNREFCEALGEPITVIPRVVRNQIGPIPPNVTFVAEAAKNPVSYLKAIAAARRSKPDLVICGHMNLLPVAFENPLLVVHGIEAWKPRRASLAKCRGIISVSALTRDRLLGWSHFAGPTYVLPNAVHLEQYGIRAKRRDLVERYHLEGKRVLLTVGRLDSAERSKGFDEVLDVLRELPEDVVYMIAGGGKDFTRLQMKAVQLGVGKRVIFTGLFDERDKPDLYNLADVYVMPSRGEGFGFVFLEAMACGVPVIGSKADGGREALRDGELGLLVDPTNPAELRAAILETLQCGERRVPPGLDYFSFDRFVERSRAIVASSSGNAATARSSS
ncbi:MAG TPA: glycosyltransferase family 4 protein, partial [Thermoanaerobaculia bacterium]|nr:glycosyltransferase family 4 protein [Thermoanaerobaculia bacterium]